MRLEVAYPLELAGCPRELSGFIWGNLPIDPAEKRC